MFIRENKTYSKKTDTTYVTHRLVESYRTEKGVRQRVILHLGTLTIPKSQWRNLAIVLESRLTGQEQMLETSPDLFKIADEVILHNKLVQKKQELESSNSDKKEFLNIDIGSIQTKEVRSLGPEIVGNEIWNKLGFDEVLKECNFSKREIAISKTVILGRLISPSSDIDTWRWLNNRTSIIEMIPSSIGAIGKNSVYEIVDLLLSNKEKIEYLLRKKEDNLFQRGETIYLYDLTNTYFEGNCNTNDLAKRGKCKSKRTDCPLVTLALMVDSYGFPIFSEIYPGNQSEPATLKDILEQLEKNTPDDIRKLIKPTIAMDRGIATKDNIKLLKELQYNYIVIERKNVEKEYIKEFEVARNNFQKIETDNVNSYGEKNSIYLKKIESDENTSRILCFSEGKEKKEISINKLKEERFNKDLESLKKSIEKKKYIKDPTKIYERIGRIKQKYPTIAKYYIITTKSHDSKIVSMDWEKKQPDTAKDILSGCYVIETTHKELEAHKIWKLYMTLTTVENSFKTLKSELGMRPVFHKKADRTKGHLFVSVLAYHLLITISNLLSESGDTREWTTIKSILSTHQRSTIVMTDENGVVHNLRINSNEENGQIEIYKKLKISNPLKTDHRIVKNWSVVT